MASITELLDKLKNARATVELVEACGKRVCSSEEHWDCPYGNESMTDCVDRLEAAYEDTIENLLQLAETIPAADVAPVAHSYWEGYSCSQYMGTDEYGEPKWRDGQFYVCHNYLCRRKTVVKSHYCPNCGAKMDGGVDHDEG